MIQSCMPAKTAPARSGAMEIRTTMPMMSTADGMKTAGSILSPNRFTVGMGDPLLPGLLTFA